MPRLRPRRPHSRRRVLQNLLRLAAYRDLTADDAAALDGPPAMTAPPDRPALGVLEQVSLLYLRIHRVAPPSATRPLPDHFVETFLLLSTLAYPDRPAHDALPLLFSVMAERLPQHEPAPTPLLQHLQVLTPLHQLLQEIATAESLIIFRLALDIAIHLYYLGDGTGLFLTLAPPGADREGHSSRRQTSECGWT